MNEEHVVAAIIAAGLIARGSSDDLQPKDAVDIYQLTLAELVASNRPARGETGS